MAGMRALGRLYDVAPAGAAATAVIACLKDCAGLGVVATVGATATGTLTFTAAKTFGGTYEALDPANGFGNPDTWYSRAANTDHWAANTASWSSGVLTISSTDGEICYVDFLVSQLADKYDYVSVLPGAAVTVTLLPYQLMVERTPELIRIPSA